MMQVLGNGGRTRVVVIGPMPKCCRAPRSARPFGSAAGYFGVAGRDDMKATLAAVSGAFILTIWTVLASGQVQVERPQRDPAQPAPPGLAPQTQPAPGLNPRPQPGPLPRQLAPSAPPATQPAPGPKGQIVLEPESFEFGTVYQGDPVDTKFTMKNAGDAELIITKVQASCGCTTAKNYKDHLAPGEKTEVAVHLDTKNKAHTVNVSVTVESNDPDHRSVTFRLKGTVNKIVEVTPANGVRIVATDPDGGEAGHVTIESLVDSPLHLEVVQNDSSKFTVKVDEITPGRKAVLTIKNKVPLTKMPLTDTIMVKTGIERAPELRIPAQALLLPRVVLQQRAIYVGPNLTQPLTRTLDIQYYGQGAFKVTDLKSGCDKIVVKLLDAVAQSQPTTQLGGNMRPSVTQRLMVTIPSDEAVPAEGCTIELTTTDPDPSFAKLKILVTKDIKQYGVAMNAAAGVPPPMTQPTTRPVRPTLPPRPPVLPPASQPSASPAGR
jgi:hypothetical protein